MIVRMKSAFAAACLLFLAACAEGPSPARPVTIPADAVATSVEQGGKFVTLVGPMAQHSEPFLGVPGTNYDSLRSMIDTRTGDATHQLYVEDSYAGAKREWNAAQDAKGKAYASFRSRSARSPATMAAPMPRNSPRPFPRPTCALTHRL